MTVKKAIQILDWWIGHKKDAMETLRKEWHFETFDDATGVAKMLFDMNKIAIANYCLIPSYTIRSKVKPKYDYQDVSSNNPR